MRMYYVDDAGDRSGDPSKPFFALGGFGINAEQLPLLKTRIRAAAFGYNFRIEHPAELKFHHVSVNRDTQNDPNWMLRARLRSREERRALVYSCLRAVADIPSLKVIVVGVDQRKTYGSESPIMHAIIPLFERINMDCAEHGTQGLVVCDEEKSHDRALRAATRTGSFYMQYRSMLDAISFMPSEESIGVQVADLIIGAFGRYLNTHDHGYVRNVWSNLRSSRGRVNGIGLKIYPRGPYPPPPPAVRQPIPEFDARVEEFVRRALHNEHMDADPRAVIPRRDR